MNIQIVQLSDALWLETLQKLSHDIYHLPEYFSIEAERSKTIPEAVLIQEGEKIFFVPYLLRRCSDIFIDSLVALEVFDAVSPYGYPGILVSEAAVNNQQFINQSIEELKKVLYSKNVCSAFFRLHPIINHEFNKIVSPEICKTHGETVSINLEISEDEIWRETRPEHRNHINRCKRTGFSPRIVKLADYIDEFIIVYNQTMNRVNAKSYFYFDSEYFLQLANFNENIHLCLVDLNNQIACAGIFFEYSRIVQYHLGGTRENFLKQAPSKLMFDFVRFWAKKRGNKIFHLGGGVGAAKDSLYNFKAGFSKRRNTFQSLRIMIDYEKYVSLVNLKAKSLSIQPEALIKSDFFPAYRYE
ncbi:MAG: GNAT family N-acetyltransferase [Scytonematopsis contorta HA4267-MV1]|nr:GNAT family N-acetyltransferase [Scytonematopsis contorta HA4267-MV1]